MTASTLIQRLNSEADSYDVGSHMHSLCSDAADQLAALEIMVNGDITSRKAMVYDNDSKTRLANDHQKKLDEALTELEESVGMAELYKEDNEILLASNAELTALLTKKRG